MCVFAPVQRWVNFLDKSLSIISSFNLLTHDDGGKVSQFGLLLSHHFSANSLTVILAPISHREIHWLASLCHITTKIDAASVTFESVYEDD